MLGLVSVFSSIKLQDAKLFFVGMFIVLLTEIFFGGSWTRKPCLPNFQLPSLATEESYFGTVNKSYAKRLASSIHVYCFIPADPKQLKLQLHLQNTWVRRCTNHSFVSSRNYTGLNVLDAPHTAANFHARSWNSMRITLQVLYANPGKNMYFLRANQNDYIIMENVRYMLEFEDPNQPFLIGHVHDPHAQIANISGTVGYVMSREALRRIVTMGLPSHADCAEKNAAEDVQISLCAHAVGVVVRDSFDFLGKSRFSNVSIFDLLGPYPNNTPRWYPQETDYTLPTYNLSKLPASPLLVGFTGIEGARMYVLEYLLYHLRAAGIKSQWFPVHSTNFT